MVKIIQNFKHNMKNVGLILPISKCKKRLKKRRKK